MKHFTGRKKNPIKQAGLEDFLVPRLMTDIIETIDIHLVLVSSSTWDFRCEGTFDGSENISLSLSQIM